MFIRLPYVTLDSSASHCVISDDLYKCHGHFVKLILYKPFKGR